MVKILVIEDEAPLLEEVVDILTFEGYDVMGAENGAIGIDLVHQHLPDMIICDIMMPVLDGYGVLMELQNDVRTRMIPFLFLTAKASQSDVRTGMNLGADDYLTKPFTHQELLDAINSRLSRQQVLTTTYEAQIEQLRDTIMITIPHELRTPLSSISGYAELLAEEYETLPSEQVKTMVSGIQRGARRLHRLIENYLLYAQLAIKKYQEAEIQTLLDFFQNHPNHPAELISDLAMRNAEKYNRPDDLTLRVEDIPVSLPLDELGKITDELTDNAFRFSKAGTPVTVTLAPTAEGFHLIISDEGRGMTAEQIARVGGFVQFDRKLHEHQGLGLGLAIAKAMTLLFGGEFVIESDEGHGTRCVIQFAG